MKQTNLLALLTPFVALAAVNGTEAEKPNILWIITDDHRADALGCYNQATRGTNESGLGYVSSPELDKLAAEGVLFTSAYCNSPASAPSRTSMHSGLYPHHRGVYGFEYYHSGPDFTPKLLTELLNEAGYHTTGIGKLGVRYRTYNESGRVSGYPVYNTFLDTKKHQSQGHTDMWNETVFKGDDMGNKLHLYYPDGTVRSMQSYRKNAPLTKEEKAKLDNVYEEYDYLPVYTGSAKINTPNGRTGLVLGGVSTNTAVNSTDGAIMREFEGYLNSADKDYKSLTGATVPGPKSDQPQFFYLGHHFPHTPVLPSKSFRDQFKDKVYNAPELSQEEYEKMPEQMKVWHSKTRVNLMTDDEKQQMIATTTPLRRWETR